MKMFKKMSALVLALCMVLTTFAVPVFAEGETIVGDANIYRAPAGKTQKIEYSVVANSDKVDGIAWSVSSHAGISIDQSGILSVEGSTAAGTVTITAAKDGATVATKDVTVVAKPEKYADLNAERHFEDFEVYANDAIIAMKGVSPNRTSIKYQKSALITPTLDLEAGHEMVDGVCVNTYAKARGGEYWLSKDLPRLQLLNSFNDGVKAYMPNSDVSTLDARFKAETVTDAKQALVFWDNAKVKIMYKTSATAGKADIYDDVKSAGTPIATVNINEWFDLRVEFDHKNDLYDVYLNNIRIVSDNPIAVDGYMGALTSNGGSVFIGASVDDLAIYNGRNADVVENVAISGNASISKKAADGAQTLNYTVARALPAGTEWRLSGAPAGVAIDQSGALTVAGNAAAGTFEIQLYNTYAKKVIGTKTVTIEVESLAITGDATIYRAPEGTTQKIAYAADVPEGTVWNLSGAPTGVTIDQSGVLRVPGSVGTGSFEIQLVNSGVVIGTKTITIPEKPEKYPSASVTGRYYEDFESYADGAAVGSTRDIKFATAPEVEVKNGNAYVKAFIEEGASTWSTATKVLKLYRSYNGTAAADMYLHDASNVVIEGDFMAETPTGDRTWPVMYHIGLGINIGYIYEEGNDYAKIVYTDDAITEGIKSTTVAYVEANDWFDVRVELDYTNYTYSAFVDGVRVIKDKALKSQARLDQGLVIGASVDNLAMYNGTKDEASVDEKTVVTKDGVVVEGATTKFNFATAQNLVLSMNRMFKNSSNETKNFGLFVAAYDAQGRLKNVALDGNSIMPGITGSLFAELDCGVVAGGYARIFVWDMNGLVPIE